MDDDRQLSRLPYDEPDPDPATRAFNRLEGEMAMLRRAVEHLATEKAEIDIPDYSKTLGSMASRLVAIERKPAMQMTPEDFEARMTSAASRARREDQAALSQVKREQGEAVRDLRAIIGTTSTIAEQNSRRWWWGGGGLLAGMLLWAILPGVILRALPTSWHMPESMAAHIIGEPNLWDAGSRMMEAADANGWNTIIVAAEMRRDNRKTINACEQRAIETRRPVRCTIKVEIGTKITG
jgi:hypothetical protein